MARKDKQVEALTHDEARRKNIPTAELQFQVEAEEAAPKEARYPRDTPLEPGTHRPRNPDLDPQLVWRGKDEQDWSDLVVHAPPLYIQEKVHPLAIIDDLRRQSQDRRDAERDEDEPDLFADFNGLDDPEARLEFYQHDQHWSNRMILGDSLQVMASLAEKEGLRGQVQCIYIDPPYGIRFNSNWQVSTRSRDVKDGKADQISREPEQIKAFRDTWKDGIHSYLTYLRDRLTVARDLLADSGSIFVQIGDENVHRVRALMDETFGEDNFISQISIQKTGGFSQSKIGNILDYVVWYARKVDSLKFRPITTFLPDPPKDDPNYVLLESEDGTFRRMTPEERSRKGPLPTGCRVFRYGPLQSEGASATSQTIMFEGQPFSPGSNSHWKTHVDGMHRIGRAGKLIHVGKSIYHRLYWDSFSGKMLDNVWLDTQSGGFNDPKVYVVQTTTKIIQRCLLMTTDPGDLVLDPTCGSGTTAYVAEQWGRRWITVDTSRVALALARARIMGARYPYYLLADSPEGLRKEAEVIGKPPAERPTHGDIRQGFVYQRVPHITLKSIANNAEIDVIWDKWRETLEPLREKLNAALGQAWEEWQIPREAGEGWPKAAAEAHAAWWEARIARQTEIDESIARKAEQEYLYDKPYEDSSRVRVAGPFTVESLSPHRVIPSDDGDELWDEVVAQQAEAAGQPAPRRTRAPHQWEEETDFAQVVLEHLKSTGVQQARKDDRIAFTSLAPWPGEYVAAEGRFMEGETERRAAIFIGPEFGTVSRPDMIAAAREAADAGFSLLIACAFNFDAHSSELNRMGPLQIVRARMNPDLHMADELKNTGQGNLFVVFGEPDIEIEAADDDRLQVRILGLDVFDPQKGEVRSGDTDDIAAWFIDTDYNEESFFVRHAYFLGAQDPYKALKTTLKAEIDAEAWASLYRDVSRPFPKPSTGRIAVKVINHFGDEVMKVFSV